MAAPMQVDLVSPDKLLASIEAEKVMLPGTDGDFTVMAGHVPVVTSLSPGAIRIIGGSEEHEYLIAGGFAEISEAGISILAEFASLRSEATPEMFQSSLEASEKSLEGLDKDELAEAQRRHGQMKSLIEAMARAA